MTAVLSSAVGQCRGGCQGARRLGPTGYCRVCFEAPKPSQDAPTPPETGDPLESDLRTVLAGIETVEKALKALRAEEVRLVRIRRTAGAATARAVAGYDLAYTSRKRRELEDGLIGLQRERDGLALEIIARDRELEEARDRADREMDARMVAV